MRFGAKILLVLACVGVAPVVFMGWLSHRVSRRELEKTVGRMQQQAAQDLALHADRFVGSAVENLRLAVGYLPWDELSRSELRAVLAIPYRQLSFVNVLAVVDDKRAPVAGPVFDRGPERDAPAGRHAAIRGADLDRFQSMIPLDRTGAVALSAPYLEPGEAVARVAVALRIGSQAPRWLAAELSLSEVAARLQELTGGDGVAFLVGPDGKLLAHGAGEAALSPAEERLVQDGLGSATALVRTVARADGAVWLAAFAPVGRLGWGAVVAQPARVAFGAAEQVRLYLLVWSGAALVIVVLLSAALAGGLTRPIRKLGEAVKALAAGQYDRKVSLEGKDELADFARAFDHMAGEIQRRGEEIRHWNEELQQRVDERTGELKAAQDQITRTRRLAAIGSLGAGVAHELNNPMTAITGYVSIVRKQLGDGSPQGEMLTRALEQAQRVTRIVEDLRRFADQELSAPGRRFSLVAPVRAALDLYADRLRAAQVLVSTRFEAGLPEVQGDPVQIQQVAAHLLDNAINAMPEGGSLEVSVTSVDGEALKLCVADTGKGVPEGLRERIFDPFFTTKEHPARVGLGLSVSHSIVEAHHGRIVVESEPGRGAAFTVLLPAAAAAAHLA